MLKLEGNRLYYSTSHKYVFVRIVETFFVNKKKRFV